MNYKNSNFGQSVNGQFQIGIVDIDGNTILPMSEWKKNLILNQGMDMIASYSYSTCCMYAIAGTGTRQNSILSGGSDATQVGSTVTLNPAGTLQHFTQSAGGFVSAVSIGDVLVYATSSTEVTVTNVSDLTCTVSPSVSITNEQFTIWKTSQTSLETECARAGGYSGIYYQPSSSYWYPGLNGGPIVSNLISIYRTYDFGIEANPITYAEIGVGRDGHGIPGTTFSRILLDSPISLAAGQRLRVAYKLNVQVMPSASVYLSGVTQPNITLWPVAPATNTNATESLQVITYAIETCDSNGNPQLSGQGGVMDPASSGYYCTAFISTESSSLASFGSAVNRNQNAVLVGTTCAAYPGAGSYYRDKVVTFALTQMNRSDIHSIGLGYGTSTATNPTNQVYTMLFEQSQSKSSTQTLTLAWRFTWGRTLANGAS